MAIARIKKNDTVICTCGNDAGKTGTVTKVDPKKGVAIVAGLNVHKKAGTRVKTAVAEGKKTRVSVKSGKAL